MPSLQETARQLVSPGTGILAADESEGTIAKRFAIIGLPVTFETRRDYREMLFRSKEAMSEYISGVILTEEDFHAALPETEQRALSRRPVPIVVPFPPPRWAPAATAPEAFIAELLRRAVGYRVRLG